MSNIFGYSLIISVVFGVGRLAVAGVVLFFVIKYAVKRGMTEFFAERELMQQMQNNNPYQG